MPKTVFSVLIQHMLTDIASEFKPDSRYRTIREIAVHFGVSLQTAQRAVKELVDKQILIAKDRSGVFIRHMDDDWKFANKTVIVASANADPRFNDAFLDGIQQAISPKRMKSVLFTTRDDHYDTYDFGERLRNEYAKCNAAGLIALAFINADLAFYHLISTDHIVLSDVASHRLPLLPSVQSDNRRHSAEAAHHFAECGKTNVLIAGYWEEGNTRHKAFTDTFLSFVPHGRCTYVHLGGNKSTADLYMFFRHFSEKDAVFVIDYAANHTVAPYFLSQEVSSDNNIIVYDSEYETFSFSNLPPIKAAAPSLATIGYRLGQKLIERIRSGSWEEPMQELI